MNPSIWIYGGVHNDPGSRRRFIEELARQKTPPHFVAVEWEKSVFERCVAMRPQVEEGLRSRWDFLTSEDCRELSLTLAWEGDAYKDRFPDIDTEPLWLESGFQEADLKRIDGMDANKFPANCARSLLELLCDHCSPTETPFMDGADPPPDPQSKKELIDRGWRIRWEKSPRDNNFWRDARWAGAICNRISGLHNGWIAVVVGWAHADPEGGNQRLRSLLLSKGFSVNSVHSVCLGP
jgi:hypothetical protein